jgi:hypothetical protein
MKKRISWIVLLILALLLSAALFTLMNLTNPLQAGAAGVLVVFALMWLITWIILQLLARLLEAVCRWWRSPSGPVKTDRLARWHKRIVWITAALSFLPLFLVSLNSIGQLSLRDVVLVVLLEALLIFYIIRKI